MTQAIVIIDVTQLVPHRPPTPVAHVQICTDPTTPSTGAALCPEPESHGTGPGGHTSAEGTARRSLENGKAHTVDASPFLTETHDIAFGASRHSVRPAQTLRVNIPWPANQSELTLEAEVSNGRAGILLLSESQGESQLHTFVENERHVLRRGRDIAEPIDALYLLITGGGEEADVDVLTDG